MADWLLKTEPDDYSIDDLERDHTTRWDGLANNAALKNVRGMKKGDRCLIYHTGKVKAAVGIAKVVSEPYEADGFDVVDLQYVKHIKKPRTLAEVKAEPKFAQWDLVRQSRLGVVPVDKEQWAFMTGGK